MNWDQIEGNWTQLKGQVKQKWGKLTDDDLTQASGMRDQIAGKIQEKYGVTKEAAEDQLQQWQQSLDQANAKNTTNSNTTTNTSKQKQPAI